MTWSTTQAKHRGRRKFHARSVGNKDAVNTIVPSENVAEVKLMT